MGLTHHRQVFSLLLALTLQGCSDEGSRPPSASSRSEAGIGADPTAIAPGQTNDEEEDEPGSEALDAAESSDASGLAPADGPTADAGQGHSAEGGASHQNDAGRGENPADANTSDSGAVDAGGGEDASGGDATMPLADAGLRNIPFNGCHQLDPLGDLVRPVTLKAIWAAPVGGAIAEGRYNLQAEEHFVPAAATPEEASDCAQYWGDYRELIVIGASDWRRVVRIDGLSIKQEIFSYAVADGRIARSVLCASDASSYDFPPRPTPYTAQADQLWLFDGYHRGDDPGAARICEIVYKYVRMP